jgi:hypothetical protein
MIKILLSKLFIPKKLTVYKTAFTFLLCIFSTSLLLAQKSTVASGNYSDAAIWLNGILPTAGDEVVIKNGNTIELDSNCIANTLTIEPGGSFTISNGRKFTITSGINVNGTLKVNEGDIELTTAGSSFKIGPTGIVLWKPLTNTVSGATLFTNGVEDFNPTSTLKIEKWYNFTNTPLGSVVTGNFGNVELSTINNGLVFEWDQKNQFENHRILGTLTINQAWIVLDKTGSITNTSINAIHLTTLNSYLDFHVGDHTGTFSVNTSEIINTGGTINGILNGNGNIKLNVAGNMTNLGAICLIYNSGVANTANGNSYLNVTGKYTQTHGDFRGIFNITTTNSGKSEIELGSAEITGGIFMANYGCHTAGQTSVLKINGDLNINLQSTNGKFRGNGLTTLTGIQNNLKLIFTVGGTLTVDGLTGTEFISSGSSGAENVTVTGNAIFKSGTSSFNVGSHQTELLFKSSLNLTGGNVYLSKSSGTFTAVVDSNIQFSSGTLSIKGNKGNANLTLLGNYNQTGGEFIFHNNLIEATENIIYLSVFGDFNAVNSKITFDNNSNSTKTHQLSLNGSMFSVTGSSIITAPSSKNGTIYFDYQGELNYLTPDVTTSFQNIKQIISAGCTTKITAGNMQASSCISSSSEMIKVNSGGVLDLGINQIYSNQQSFYSGITVDENGRLRISSRAGLYNGTSTAAISSSGNMSYVLHTNSIVEYYGNEIQIVTGTGVGSAQTELQQYGILEINKPSAKAVLMASDVIIRTGLYLNNGELDLNSFNITVASGKTYAITRTYGYIRSESDNLTNSGQVKWKNIDSGIHTIPFGISESKILQVSFTPITGIGKEFAVATKRSQTDNRPLPNGVLNLNVKGIDAGIDKIIDRYYFIQAQGVTADITLSYLPEENTTATEFVSGNFSIMQWANSKWNILGGNGKGQITSNGKVVLNNCGNWGNMLLVSYETPLYADILQFKADLVFKQVNVNWTAKAGIIAEKYIIERSSNLESYVDVLQQNAMPHSSTTINYTDIDYNPLPGTSYYRLKQISTDGTIKYSDAVKISNLSIFNQGIEIVAAIPNPFTDNFTINFTTGTEGTVDLTLSTLTGQKIYSETIEAKSGSNKFEYSSEKYINPGIYLLNISNGKTKATQKLLKI